MSEPEQTFTITHEWLHQHKSADGGWSRRQLVAIGVEWPPKHGWQIGVIGAQISDTSRKIFEHQCAASPAVLNHPQPTIEPALCVSLELDDEADAHIKNEVFQRQLVALADYYIAQIRAARKVIDDVEPRLETLRFLDPPSLDLEYRGIFMSTR